jgi:hypothetical protein
MAKPSREQLQEIFSELRQSVDVDDQFMKGHRVITPKKPAREIPDWARSDEAVRKLLLRSFPKLATSGMQRFRAARWMRVIQLYFRVQNSVGQVAKEMGLKKKTVQNIIQRVYLTSQGLRADGSAPLVTPETDNHGRGGRRGPDRKQRVKRSMRYHKLLL